jgi:molecular chaperone GrpE
MSEMNQAPQSAGHPTQGAEQPESPHTQATGSAAQEGSAATAAHEFNPADFADIGLQASGGLSLEAEVDKLKHELATAQAKLAQQQDLYVRAVAEAENIRRRAADDVSKAHKFAIESFAEALIPAKDSLEMALTIPNQTLESLREGVEATLRQLATGFEKGRLQELNPVGEKFDPHRHQAVSMVPGGSVEPPVASNHVVAVLQKGYLISDRVLRPALVAVAQ